MAKPNPYIDKAIKQAKVLRQLVLRMNEKDRALEAVHDEEEAQLKAKKDSTDYPVDTMGKFFDEGKDYEDQVIADYLPQDENQEILFLCDKILYKLMAYDADDKWHDAPEYIERTQLKLKEIVSDPFQLKEILKKPSSGVYKEGFSY